MAEQSKHQRTMIWTLGWALALGGLLAGCRSVEVKKATVVGPHPRPPVSARTTTPPPPVQVAQAPPPAPTPQPPPGRAPADRSRT